jgi:hypothetical protein
VYSIGEETEMKKKIKAMRKETDKIKDKVEFV